MSLTDEIMAKAAQRLGRSAPSRPNNSKGHTDQDQPIEMFGHRPSGAADCGRVALLRNPSGQAVAARLFCKRKTCPDCGPFRVRRLALHYREAIGDTPVVRFLVERAKWPTRARQLSRSKASYLRIPAPGATYVVFATAGPGEPVTDLGATLDAAFAAMPAGDAKGRPDTARVSSSRCWAESKPVRAGTGSGRGDDQGKWELVGLAGVSLDQVVKVAQEHGLYLGPVDARDLAAAWAEAHLLRLPPAGTPEYLRFTNSIRLHWPARHRRGVDLAA